MSDVIVQPLLAGLSTGLFCCAYCFPFIAPVLVAEERSGRQTARVLAQFILGRLIGYAAFGVAIGYLGERLDEPLLHKVSVVSLILLSAFLVVYALGLVRPAWVGCSGGKPPARGKAPFLMGLFMGFNMCPPFLMSVVYVFTLHSMVKGLVYFVVFFVATTIYFIPLALLGMLSRMAEFRAVARVSAILVGALFAAYGIYTIGRGASLLHMP